MKIVNGEVTFEKDDWTTGLSKEAIAFMKINGGKYMPERKVWAVGPKIESMLRERFTNPKKVKVHDDLEESLGTSANGKVSMRGIIGMFREMSDALDLIEYLGTINAKEEIAERLDSYYDEKLKAFNELVIEKEKA